VLTEKDLGFILAHCRKTVPEIRIEQSPMPECDVNFYMSLKDKRVLANAMSTARCGMEELILKAQDCMDAFVNNKEYIENAR
jgi:hypothetical protein